MRGWLACFVIACASTPPHVRLTDTWPGPVGAYNEVTRDWTRRDVLRGQYQEVLALAATFKSPDWRAAHATREAELQARTGKSRDELLAQAQADMAGPYEVELLVTTWDPRENDLDRGKRSVWRVVLIDEQGNQIEPLEIIKDKRPFNDVRGDFPAFVDFAKAYIARYPRATPVLGAGVHRVRLHMSSVRGSVDLAWESP
jgi:hypothetical protein